MRSEAVVDADGSMTGMSVEGAAVERPTMKTAHRPCLGPGGQEENGAGGGNRETATLHVLSPGGGGGGSTPPRAP